MTLTDIRHRPTDDIFGLDRHTRADQPARPLAAAPSTPAPQTPTLSTVVAATTDRDATTDSEHTADTADTDIAEADDRPVRSSFARCADGNGTLTHLFFSDDVVDIARAKAICSKCGLATRCLGDALDRSEPHGVWGGELLIDGEVVAIKRGRGRPPKTPRPTLVVDEVPIPPHLVA